MKNRYEKKTKKSAPNKKRIIFSFILIAAAITGIAVSAHLITNNNSLPAATPVDSYLTDSSNLSQSEQQILPEETPQTKSVTFCAAGDNLIHGAIYMQAQNRAIGTDKQYDFAYIYKNISSFIQGYDIRFINQETLVNNELAASTYPCFSTPGELGEAAYNAGFRVFAQSNNHIYDKGAAGISATLNYWRDMPSDVVTTGLYKDEADYDNIKTNTVNGITFSYLAYTQYTNGIPTPANAEAHIIYTEQEDVIEHQIKLAKEISDCVVVSVHWGIEDSHTVTDAQRLLAQKMSDWGADVIIGTHPHVIQTAEWLTGENGNKTFCAYSLGNFVSAQSRPDELIEYMLTFNVDKNADGTTEVNNVKIYPCVNHYDYGYSNIRVYLLKDYTAELADSHGVRTEYSYFNLDYINQVVNEYIPQEFLA